MNEVANQLAQSLFKKNTLQECSRWELEILADKYPYFGIAQFLLAGKLREENNEAYLKQIQKTSLYFTNPLWLDYTLSSSQDNAAKQEEAVNGKAGLENKETLPQEHLRFAPKIDEPATIEEVIAEETAPAEATANETTEEPITEQPAFISPEETKIEEINTAVEEPIASPEPVDLQSEQSTTAATPEIEQTIGDSQETVVPEEQTAELKIAPLKIEPMPDPNAPLVFEAFHTVDYFASQGIKLKADDLPKDRFGQQLKSFTEWLKTLKKTPATEISKQVDKGTEQKVITLAEHSIENRDVVTEAMAEVWAKQGNKEKAIDVYGKLSLQNPAKSSYFAALIEQLKQS